MAIVTISHQLGSGGNVIARAVADRLGYQCIGGEILAKAAQVYGLAEDRLTRLGEAKPSVLDRLGLEAQTYIAVMQNAVLDAALADHVVLVGRGGQWLLRDIAHALRVRIIAPLDERIRRLQDGMATQVGGEASARTARDALERLLRRDDADKLGRMRYLYDCDLNDPLLYDVLINNRGADGGAATEAIVSLAHRPGAEPTAASMQRLVDRAVASRVRVALMVDERTRRFKHFDAEATNGSIRVTTRAPAAAVEAVARAVDGVRQVEVTELPVIPMFSE
ncbi:MAG TPA: cytidylate kinase-like family protein [Methylomirabilota bacterium]|jgi:cytidylate kinase